MIIHDVEQNTEAWLLLRAGIPTASEFSKIITSKGDTGKTIEKYARTLAAEKIANGEIDQWQGNYHTDRGHELEDGAVKAYNFNSGEDDVERVGFVTDDDVTVGCSPDGLVGKDGLIEIKCLKAETHIETVLYYKKHGKAPTTYFSQVQGQMMITGRKWCDLFFYYPTLPHFKIRCVPDVDFVKKLKTEIKNVSVRRDEIIKIMESVNER